MSKECYDHLGNKFKSLAEMCRHYGINADKYKRREINGWTLKERLTGKVTCYDHLGNGFKTKREMCKFYNIDEGTFASRIRYGWSVKDALEMKEKKCYDHLGNEFNTVSELVKHYGISETLYYKRILEGNMSLEEVLTTPKYNTTLECCDHLGNKFKSQAEMCRYYGVEPRIYRNRIRLGWTIADALTKKGAGKECFDHLGNKFNSIKEMYEHYGLSKKTFKQRIRLGWSLEDALTKDVIINKVECEDAFGNKFKSIGSMSNRYGIISGTFRRRKELGWHITESLGIANRGLDSAIKNKEVINIHIVSIKFAYIGVKTKKIYYTCIDKDTGDELLLNADEILMYKQSDYRTAVEQLIKRRKEKLQCHTQQTT